LNDAEAPTIRASSVRSRRSPITNGRSSNKYEVRQNWPRLISSLLSAELHQGSVEQAVAITLALGCRLEDTLGQRGLGRRGSLGTASSNSAIFSPLGRSQY
jgi:hypothetical protein